MAEAAMAQPGPSFNPQNAAADLRRAKMERPKITMPNVPPSPRTDEGNERMYAEEEQKHRIASATRRDAIPENNERMMTQEEALESGVLEDVDADAVSELNRARHIQKYIKQQAAQEVAAQARKVAKQFMPKVVRYVAGFLGLTVNTAEAAVAETDFGIGSLLDVVYIYIKMAVTIFTRDTEELGDSVGDVAKNVSVDAIRIIFPPYTLKAPGDLMIGIFVFVVSVALGLCIFFIAIIIIAAAVGVGYGTFAFGSYLSSFVAP